MTRKSFLFTLIALLTLMLGVAGSPSLRSRAGLSPQPELAGTGPAPDGPARHEPQITPEQAIALAVNDLTVTDDGYRLRHPRHTATFTSAGLRFVPRRGGPDWRWELTYVGSAATALAGVEVGAVRPVQAGPQTVAYRRGAVVEQYLMREQGIEQQFVIPQPLALGGADPSTGDVLSLTKRRPELVEGGSGQALVIAGRVDSAGLFEATEEGWLWRTDEGVVSLGDVRVLDARGTEVPATMRVTATRTEIVVEGAALARAAYPVTIDPEIGANDFRISDMGLDGDDDFDARDPAVAYNSTDKMTNVTASAWGGSQVNAGVHNRRSSSPTMTNVTASASKGDLNFGVYNLDNSSPTMTDVIAAASGGNLSLNYGVRNEDSSSPRMANVTASASGGLESSGVYNYSSSPTIHNSALSASGGANNYGIYNWATAGAYTVSKGGWKTTSHQYWPSWAR